MQNARMKGVSVFMEKSLKTDRSGLTVNKCGFAIQSAETNGNVKVVRFVPERQMPVQEGDKNEQQ